MMKKTLSIVFISLFLFSSSFAQALNSTINENKYEDTPFAVPYAYVLPNIDGEVHPEEWDGAHSYTYTRYLGNNPVILKLSLKYAGDWLYLLFKIIGIDDSDGAITILTTPKNNSSIEASSGFIIFTSTDEIKNFTFTQTGVNIDWKSSPSVYARVSSYLNKELVAEIKMNKKYLHIYCWRYAPFNIEYTPKQGEDFAWENTIAIGVPRTISPGLDFMNVRPLLVYKAKVIPKIDGKISEGEWDDARLYTYTRKSPLNNLTKLQCALKYDEDWLYVLVKVNDTHSGSFLIFNVAFRPDEDPWDFYSFAFFPDGRAKEGSFILLGYFVIDWESSVNAKVKGTYSSNGYIFEIKFDKKYLHMQYVYAPFNILYARTINGEYPANATIGIEGFLDIDPGLVFSPSYYKEYSENESKESKIPWDYIEQTRIMSIIAICLSTISICLNLYSIYRYRRKNNGKSKQRRI